MSNLGIITCQILELEFAHVLSTEPDVSELRKNIEEFNQKYDLRTETRPGTLAILESAWAAAKRAVGMESP